MRKRGVRVGIFGPTVDVEEIVSLPALGGRREALEAEGDFVAGAHDDELVVGLMEEWLYVAIAGVEAGSGIPGGFGEGLVVEEGFGVTALGIEDGLGEAVEAEVGLGECGFTLTDGSGFVDGEEGFIPIDAHVGDDADFARSGEEFAGEIDGDGLGFAGGDAHVFDDGAPLAGLVADLQIGGAMARPGCWD